MKKLPVENKTIKEVAKVFDLCSRKKKYLKHGKDWNAFYEHLIKNQYDFDYLMEDIFPEYNYSILIIKQDVPYKKFIRLLNNCFVKREAQVKFVKQTVSLAKKLKVHNDKYSSLKRVLWDNL